MGEREGGEEGEGEGKGGSKKHVGIYKTPPEKVHYIGKL